MENDGLSKNPGQCVCIGWPTGGELGAPSQHQNSCLMHPDNIARDALDALRAWAVRRGRHPSRGVGRVRAPAPRGAWHPPT